MLYTRIKSPIMPNKRQKQWTRCFNAWGMEPPARIGSAVLPMNAEAVKAYVIQKGMGYSSSDKVKTQLKDSFFVYVYEIKKIDTDND